MASMRATAGEPRLDCPTTCVAVPRRRWPGFQSSQPLGSADSRPSAFRSRRTVLGPPTWLANAQTEDVREPEPRPAVELPILRNNASGPKLPPLRCTVPGSRIRDRRTGTAQNGYLVGGVLPALRLVQLLPDSPDVARHARDGSRHHGARVGPP